MAADWRRNRFFGGVRGEQDTLFRLFLGSLVLMVAGLVYIIGSGQGRETWLVVSGTMPFYILASLILIGGILFWFQHENFTAVELVLFVCIALPCSYTTLGLSFLWFTDLGHAVIWNSKIKEMVWKEAWIDRADGKNDTDTHHGPEYNIRTAADERISTTRKAWLAFVGLNGGRKRVNSRRNMGADRENRRLGSDGDGIPEVHTITWDGREESEVPTSREHIEANYLQAADTSLKIKGVKQDYQDYLVDYPRVTSGTYGDIEFDRVIESKVKVGGTFHYVVDRGLDKALQTLGSKKQCNIVVFVAGTENVGLFQALREHWKEGKKNDICVCIGYTRAAIHWCKVMTYTDHTMFVENLERDVRHLETLEGKGDALVKVILSNINAAGDAGYLRKPMADYEFLASDVEMPWYTLTGSFLWACAWLSCTVMICIRD
jgi:hypothetical protein